MKIRLTCCVLWMIVFASCNQEQVNETTASIKFTAVPSSTTKINFNNAIVENDSINLISDAYTYMGAGVGIGDFNKDGLPDVFFSANQQSSKLYVNKGKFVFEDITAKAGLQTHHWITGVSVVDINSDGYDDIYLCVAGNNKAAQRKNLLFINNKDLTFSEQSDAYGLADTSYSTQAVFFDYDKDGDLDMYLVNHLLDHENSNNIVERNLTGKSPARDKLYRNEGVSPGQDHPFYKDVSFAAGIVEDGYGLGVVMSDINNDGWPDLYVTNDYLANDLLWINNHDGTFTNTIASSIKHQSYSSMGVDAGDINNDGLQDIISLDMQPEDNRRKKLMYSFLNYDRYVMERRAGYQDEYMRNMLQVNNGNLDSVTPFFSELGQMAGISETDWSWSVLMADLNNDGFKDVHITNGLGRDMINHDFISFGMDAYRHNNGSKTELNKMLTKTLNEYGIVEISNYCYQNNGDFSFADVSKSAGIDMPAISNGCAYADLDMDGDLDLVVNNINKEAFVLMNNTRQTNDTTNNYLSVSLAGDRLNYHGFGAKLMLYNNGQIQNAEQAPIRGYLSSVDQNLFFGLGNKMSADSLIIRWPNGKQQTLRNLKANQTIQLKEADAVFVSDIILQPQDQLFTNVTTSTHVDYKHNETFFYDYGFQQTLPQKYSQLGPFIATGDVNGDGLEDFFVGGASRQSGRFFMQQSNGQFLSKDLDTAVKYQDDLGCLLFDADGDKDLDLYINSGSNEIKPMSQGYAPRLYRNDGKGNFTLDAAAFPLTVYNTAQCFAASDYDKDGDIDLFVGGRITPNHYPVAPPSFLLQNDGTGHFNNVTEEVCEALQTPGMITAAVWVNLNDDDKPDLVIAGEWMAVRFFINDNGKLVEKTNTGLPAINGFWRSLAASDIDKDGDMDIVAGNMGQNNKYKLSAGNPVKLYASDLDNNGSIDPVMEYSIKNEKGDYTRYPAFTLDQLSVQVPSVKKKYLRHTDFATATIKDVLSGFNQEEMITLECNEASSVWFENKGGGKFEMHVLPSEVQWAPVNSIICTDIDRDGNTDLLTAGNEYQAEVSTGRYDASYGLYLKGDGKGNFKPIRPTSSGLIIQGDAKDLKLISTLNKERLLIAAINDEKVQVFKLR